MLDFLVSVTRVRLIMQVLEEVLVRGCHMLVLRVQLRVIEGGDHVALAFIFRGAELVASEEVVVHWLDGNVLICRCV